MLGITDVMAAGGQAAATPGAGESLMGMLPMLAVMFGLFYFMIIRPQSKKSKEHKALIEQVKVEDEVLTSGGVMAKIVEVGANAVRLSVSDGMTLTIQKTAIASVLPKGTIKEAL